ncbi:MAG: T9SS type A sorting domain-containing protein, partial [Bacteroidales bacterium]|nr:T9SS type A sorting domain-containing protein [Bacteroidales bacterium]
GMINQYWDNTGWEKSYRVAYTYNVANLITSYIGYSWTGSSWQLNTNRVYAYDSLGNCVSDIAYRGSQEANKYLYTYFNDELVSDYILPEHPEPIYPEFVHFYNKPRWYTWWSLDDNDVLQYICCYHFLFGDPTGVESPVVDNHSVVFPNPATSSFNIQNHKICGVEIYNAEGKLVKTDNTHHTNITSVNCQDLENGTYFVKIFDGLHYETQKVVVNK